MSRKRSFHYAWVILLVLCVIRSLSAAGINNTGGLFLAPVAKDLNVGVGNLSIYFSISSLATLIFMPFGGKIINAYSARIVILVATVLQVGSYSLLGFMNSIWGWYLLSIPMGIGGAVLVNLIGPILINRWFHKQAGLALGLLMASMGIFGTFLQPIYSNVIAQAGWRQAYIIPGFIIFVILVILTVVFMYSKPADKGLQALKEEELSQEAQQARDAGVSFAFASKTSCFYALIVFMIAITAFGAFNQHMATYGTSLGYPIERVGLVLSFSMIGSTIGALIIGWMSDRIGVYRSAIIVVGIVLLSLVCLLLGSVGYTVLALGSFLLGLGSMGIPVLAPLLTKEYFGEKAYETIYSSVMVGPPLASIILLPLYGFIYDATSSYRMVFILLVILIIIGGCSLFYAQKKDLGSGNE